MLPSQAKEICFISWNATKFKRLEAWATHMPMWNGLGYTFPRPSPPCSTRSDCDSTSSQIPVATRRETYTSTTEVRHAGDYISWRTPTKRRTLVTILTLIWRLNPRFIRSLLQYTYCLKWCKTLYFVYVELYCEILCRRRLVARPPWSQYMILRF